MKIVQLEYFCMVSQYHSITQAALRHTTRNFQRHQGTGEGIFCKSFRPFQKSSDSDHRRRAVLPESQRTSGLHQTDHPAVLRSGEADSSHPHRHPAAVKHDFFSGSRPGI